MLARYKEICDVVVGFKDHRSSLVRDTVIALLPQLAAFEPDAFVRRYMGSITINADGSSSSSSSKVDKGQADRDCLAHVMRVLSQAQTDANSSSSGSSSSGSSSGSSSSSSSSSGSDASVAYVALGDMAIAVGEVSSVTSFLSVSLYCY
jgi:hypothetical protein